MENKEKVIEIIKKLFALAEKNTNEAESKKAMLKAQKMLVYVEHTSVEDIASLIYPQIYRGCLALDYFMDNGAFCLDDIDFLEEAISFFQSLSVSDDTSIEVIKEFLKENLEEINRTYIAEEVVCLENTVRSREEQIQELEREIEKLKNRLKEIKK